MRIRRRKSVSVDAFDHTSEVMSMGNTCVCCGDPIPEGRQVCPICEDRAEQTSDRDCEQSPSEAHDGGDPRRGPKKVCPICEDRAEEAAQQKHQDTDEEGSEDDGT